MTRIEEFTRATFIPPNAPNGQGNRIKITGMEAAVSTRGLCCAAAPRPNLSF